MEYVYTTSLYKFVKSSRSLRFFWKPILIWQAILSSPKSYHLYQGFEQVDCVPQYLMVYQNVLIDTTIYPLVNQHSYGKWPLYRWSTY